MTNQRIETVDGFRLAVSVNAHDCGNVAIWMHGISVNKDEYLGFFREGAERLARQGISSVRFDFRGHGESSGTPDDFCVVGQNIDARAVFDFTAQEFGQSRIHLIGASFGAPPALFAAARYANSVASVSLIAPVLSYRRTFLEPETEWAKEVFAEDRLHNLDKTGRLYFDSDFYIGHRLVEEMRLIRPDLELRGLNQRILVIHGDRDSMVPYDATVQACHGLSNVTLITLHGADHGFMEAGDDEGVTRASRVNKESIYKAIEEQMRC